jgi:hypothetical protein
VIIHAAALYRLYTGRMPPMAGIVVLVVRHWVNGGTLLDRHEFWAARTTDPARSVSGCTATTR